MLKRALPAKVELIDSDPGADTPRKVYQVVINGVPVLVPADSPPEVEVCPDGEIIHYGSGSSVSPGPVRVTLTLWVSELTIRAARDEDLRDDESRSWKYSMPPLDDAA